MSIHYNNPHHIKMLAIASAAWMLFATHAAGQSLEALLAEVERNHPALAAEEQWRLSQQALLRTGLSLTNPELKADYMLGRPQETAGNQFDFTVGQTFLFPTAYALRRQVAKTRTAGLPFRTQAARQRLLLEAKQKALQVVGLNRRIAELQNRLATANRLQSWVRQQLDLGEATALDANKAQLMRLNFSTELARAEAENRRLLQELAGLNGGNPVQFSDTLYPDEAALQTFPELFASVEAADPIQRQLESEVDAAQQQVALAKALALPRFQAGYRQQSLLGQRFTGAFVSFTVPLWENRFRVQAQQENQLYQSRLLEAHRNEHFHYLKGLFEELTLLRQNLEGYQATLNQLNPAPLLEKALNLGEITVVQYYLELMVLYQSQDQFHATLQRCHQVQAELFRHEL